MQAYVRFYILVVVFHLCPPSEASAQFAEKLWKRSTLTGDWWGLRTRLADRGIRFEGAYTGENLTNALGGLRRGSSYLDDFDLILVLDAHKLLGWKDATLFLYGLGNQGSNPSNDVGDVQGVSNIAAYSTWKLYEAWLQQNLTGHRISLLAGLYDLNSEFDVLDAATLFLNSSHGIDITFSQSGRNGPSIFPNATIGMRAKWSPAPWVYLQTVVLNGVAGNPMDPRGTQITFGKNDGILSTTEAAYLIGARPSAPAESGRKRRRRLGRLAVTNYHGKLGLGVWVYTAKFDAILKGQGTDEPAMLHGNYGIYFLWEQTVYREEDPSAQNLTLFARVGFANARINRFGMYTGGGLVYVGLLPGRDHDQLGFAVAGAHNGGDYKKAQQRAGRPVDASEWNLELTYHAQLTPWLGLQPDIQYVINPNTDPLLENSLAVDVRIEIAF